MLLHSKTIIYPVRFNQVKLVRFILVKVSAHIYSFLPSVTNQVKLVHLTGNSPNLRISTDFSKPSDNTAGWNCSLVPEKW